jgi:hypothetical protein
MKLSLLLNDAVSIKTIALMIVINEYGAVGGMRIGREN